LPRKALSRIRTQTRWSPADMKLVTVPPDWKPVLAGLADVSSSLFALLVFLGGVYLMSRTPARKAAVIDTSRPSAAADYAASYHQSLENLRARCEAPEDPFDGRGREMPETSWDSRV
jgi:hypothetical protein